MWWLLVLALLTPLPIAMVVSPRIAFEPAYVRVRITLQPDALNRVVCVVYEGGESGASSSCWQVEGDKAPITYQREFKDVPAGNYEFRARVARADGSTKSSAPMTVEIQSRH